MRTGERTAAKGPVKTEGGSFIKHWLIGVGAGLLGTAFTLAIFAFTMTLHDFGGAFFIAGTTAILALGGFLAGFVAARIRRQNGMAIGALSGVLLYLLYLGLSLLTFGLAFGPMAITKLAICVIPACLGGVWGVNYRKKHR